MHAAGNREQKVAIGRDLQAISYSGALSNVIKRFLIS